MCSYSNLAITYHKFNITFVMFKNDVIVYSKYPSKNNLKIKL